MATYYVRTPAKGGSDGAAGTSPATAWATITKALGAAGISSGDTVYIGAGVYRDAVTMAMVSATVETFVIGDVTGQFTGDAGMIEWTGYTTSDTASPNSLATLTPNGRDFMTFRNICFVGSAQSSGDCVNGGTATSTNFTFEDCTFEGTATNGGSSVILFANASNLALNLTIRRCAFLFMLRGISVNATANATADYDIGLVVENCVFYTSGRDTAIRLGLTGSTNTFGGGGEKIRNCTYFGASSFVGTVDVSHADGALAASVTDCLVVGGSSASLVAQTSGHISADWNFYYNNTANTNVTDGGNSYGPSLLTKRRGLSFGQERIVGLPTIPLGTPVTGSPLLGFHTNASLPSVDMLNRPRPSGGVSATYAVGALERHDIAISPGTTIGSDSGTGYIEIVGAGDDEFPLAVDAVATTITIKTKTSGYSGTNYPRMSIINGEQCGVAAASVDATSASASAYEAISLTFTPTAKGIVTIRLANRSANGTGITAFDSVTVT